MGADSRRVVRVGSRKSQLALLQTNIIINRLRKIHHEIDFEVVEIATLGDKILNVALSKIGDKNLFTKELEQALYSYEIDFVVHSLKDVPTVMPDGLVIGCISDRCSPFDVVLMSPTNRGKTLAQLPPESVIGTSALRRIAVLKRQFPHLEFLSIRGNLSTRLKKLDAHHEQKNDDSFTASKYDALILAEAGVARIGMEERIDEHLEGNRYAVGQGALACECRAGDTHIQHLLSTIHDESAALACITERAFMSRLEGGCSTPIAVRTQLTPGGVAGTLREEMVGRARSISLDAVVLSVDGLKSVEGKLSACLPTAPTDCCRFAAGFKRARLAPNANVKLWLDDEITEQEEASAENREVTFLGVSVIPACRVARLRMARARRLGEVLADQLYASGADTILEEIRANPPHELVSATVARGLVNDIDSSPSQDNSTATKTTVECVVAEETPSPLECSVTLDHPKNDDDPVSRCTSSISLSCEQRQADVRLGNTSSDG